MMTKGLGVVIAGAFGAYVAPVTANYFGVWGYGDDLLLRAIGAGVLGTVALMVLTQRPV